VSIEGLLRWLCPDFKVTDLALPYAKELLAGQYDPSRLQGGLLRTLLRFQSFATDFPVQLSQILFDLEAGKFAVNVRAEQMDRLNHNLRAIGVIAFLGLCACGFIVGAFISFSQQPWNVGGVPILGILGVASSAALFGATISWYWLGGRFRKISISRLLKKR
jgi:ubiquinone biosynthesis protein